MVKDLFDDLVAESIKLKKDFVKTIETMDSIKRGKGAFNGKFAAIGDKGKCKIVVPPIRDGDLGGRPKYMAQVVDITDIDTNIPVPIVLTMYHLQQIYVELFAHKIFKSTKEFVVDKKLKRSIGTAWEVEAVGSTYTGVEKKRDYMLQFTYLPDESTLDADAIIKDIGAEMDKQEQIEAVEAV